MYVTESAITSSGVPIRRSSQGVSVVPASVSSAAASMLKDTEVWIARRIFSSSRAPK